jgi:hypothetical protein
VDFLPDGEVQRALRAVAAGAAAGSLRPLPLVGHSLSGVAVALRAMSQVRGCGGCIGKGWLCQLLCSLPVCLEGGRLLAG